MREILFRGKRIDNGEWVYGAYITMHHNDERTHIHHFIIPDGSDMSYGVKLEDILVAVDGDTVCQYASLPDKNKKKMFERDIVRCKSYVGTIIFSGAEYRIRWKDKLYKRHDLKYWCDVEEVEVIGNVFDNPELLEAEE